MEILKFKTNLTGEDEVAKVAPLLDKIEAIQEWQVDTQSSENILSVSGQNLDPQRVENALAEAGFRAEVLRVLGIDGEGL